MNGLQCTHTLLILREVIEVIENSKIDYSCDTGVYTAVPTAVSRYSRYCSVYTHTAVDTIYIQGRAAFKKGAFAS